jgi:hypothetical protein
MYRRYRVGIELNQLHLHAPLTLPKSMKALAFHLARAQEHQLHCDEQRHLGQAGQRRLPMKQNGSDLQIVRAELGAELCVDDAPKPSRQLLQ